MLAKALLLVVATTALGLTSCHGKPPDFGHVNKSSTSRGLFFAGFEQHSFMPCAADETWWWGKAYPTDPDWLMVDDLFDDSCDPEEDPYCGLVYMEVDGSVSEPGQYGHLGQYERELIVSRVYYASVDVPAGCKRANRR